ncbi:hypothetical protein P3L10_019253 [Capsicum annuum]
MARGRGQGHESTRCVGKSVAKSNPDVTATIPTIPTSTIVSPQAGVIQTFGDGSNPTIPKSSSTAPNQINITVENMTRGRGTGRGSIVHVGKSAARSNIPVLTANMPTIPTPAVTPQASGDIGGPTSNHGSNPTTPESSPTSPNQSNPIVLGTSSQTNQVGEDVSRSNINGESNSSRTYVRTLVTITSAGIHESFKSELYHNGINWKGVACDIKDGYFGEFKKHFYWDSSISDAAVKKQWQIKAAIVYRNFIAKLKDKGISQDFRHEDVWESWQRLWKDPKCVEKSKINAQNHRGGKEVAVGTNTGGSISIGEYQKRLVTAEIGRYPTPSELHLHLHTHGHDEKSFIDERSRIIHERYEEILREKIFSETNIDQIKAYYQTAGGEKKRRVFGLGSEAKSYYGQTLCVSCGKTSSSASH